MNLIPRISEESVLSISEGKKTEYINTICPIKNNVKQIKLNCKRFQIIV